MLLSLLARSLTAALLFGASAFAALAGPDLAGMKMIAGDEFGGPSIDQSKWLLGIEPNGTPWGSDSYFVTGRPVDAALVPQTYIQADGKLTIRATYDAAFADRQPWKRHWSSGLIVPLGADGTWQSATFRKGCAEIRAKLPGGAGTWPGFWALNAASMQKGGDPLGQLEIDGLEQYGHNRQGFYSTLHNWTKPAAQVGHYAALINPVTLMRTYDFCLDDKTLKVWVDGTLKNTLTLYRPDPMDKVFWMFNLAMGGGWPVTVPASSTYDMQIDYVRIYSAD